MMKSAVVLVAIAATTDVALSQTSFAADNAIAAGVTGTGDAVPGVANAAADEVAQDDAVLEETSDIRGISDTWASNGNTVSSTGMSNMVWSFGQFVDHDLTLTIEEIENDPDFASASADAKFDLVRTIITSKYQKVILEEFLPALGITESDLENAARLINRPDVSAEFSIAYRLGHDLIPNIVGGIAIADSFNAENFLLDQGGTPSAPTVTFKTDAETRITNMLTGLATESANEIDGRLSDALRNLLFGAAEEEDLAGRNIFRGRELGIPTYGALATCYDTTADTQVEMDTPDAWLGLLREPKGTAPLPPTLREIILEQFGRSFFGPGGLFWRRFVPDLGKFLPEVEASTYATIISTNTNAAVTGNVFSA